MNADPTARELAQRAVLAYYAAFNLGDIDGLLRLLDDDVVHDINQGDREVGKPAFRSFLMRMDRCYREQVRDVMVCTSPDGSRAAAEYVVHGTYRQTDVGQPPATGQTYVLPGGAFFGLNGGRIARVGNHYNVRDWLRQISAAA